MSQQLLLAAVLLLYCALHAVGTDTRREYKDEVYSVIRNSAGKFELEQGMAKEHLAFGTYVNTVDSTGWDTISLTSNPAIGHMDQGLAVGYLEGALTHTRMLQYYVNYLAANNLLDGQLPPKVRAYIATQNEWMWTNVANSESLKTTNRAEYNYWQHVGVLLSQVKGMAQGYNDHCTQDDLASVQETIQQFNITPFTSCHLSEENVYTLTMVGDLEGIYAPFSTCTNLIPTSDLLPALGHSKKGARGRVTEGMDCSGLIKWNPDTKDIYSGHTTFNGYAYMLRIFKHYTMELPSLGTAASIVSFSSRPGDLESKDDYYQLSSNMIVIETSLSMFNASLHKFMIPQTVPTWLRCQLANRLAKGAKDWAELFAKHNSGTHNNEWIVLDYKKYNKQNPLAADTVWMIETMPGVVEKADVTATLLEKQQYVPSYNIPYFPYIFQISGYAAHGFNYTTDPRAEIFRRDQGSVNSVRAMATLMNSNNWQHDPLSQGSPCNAISARCDLLQTGASAFGGIDCKVTNKELTGVHHTLAISSPTHAVQPVFEFGTKWGTSVPHAGMPNRWNFEWVWMKP